MSPKMSLNRRRFLSTTLAGGAAASVLPASSLADTHSVESNYAKLDEVIAQPGFKREYFKDPVVIKSVELLRSGRSFICRVRSKDGAEAAFLDMVQPVASSIGYALGGAIQKRASAGRSVCFDDDRRLHRLESCACGHRLGSGGVSVLRVR